MIMASNVPTDYAQRLQRAADLLFEIPGVVSVGLGGKITRGQRTDKLSLTIMVLKKKTAAELAPNEIIPAEIEGFVTDVVQGRPPRRIAEQESPEDFDAGVPRDEAEYPVIVGGIRIRAESSRDFDRRKFFGTLGCFVVDKKDANKRYLLTNHHVLADEFGEVNGPSCTGCTKGDQVGNPDSGRKIANVERGKDDEFVDAAIAVLDKGVQFVREIINDNAPNQRELVGPPRILVPHNPPDLNIAVHKRGHRSLLTEAVVGDIVAIMNPKIGKVAKRNQIRIDLPEKITGGTVTFAAGGKMIVDGEDLVAKGVKVHDVAWVDGVLNHGRYLITAVGPPLQPNELIVAGDLKLGGPSAGSFFVTGPMFGLHGDSGSIVLDANSRVVGLLWAADSFGRTGNAWAIPIDAVQTALGVNIDTATSIGDIQVASGARGLAGPAPALEPAPVMRAAEEADPAAHATLRDRVEQDLLAVPRGRDIYRLYFKHHMEVRELIDRNRRVATVWHRQGGPGLIQSVLDAVRCETSPVADNIRGRSWSERVGAILDVFQRFGSERLRDDIATFGNDITGLGGMTYPRFLENLKG
jgi:S1-C subfamily serine protease